MGKFKHTDKLLLKGDDVPTVDILVSHQRESMEVLLDTLRAAGAIDYPTDRFRLIVFDSEKSGRIRSLVQGLGMTNLCYLTSKESLKPYSRAATLHHSLQLLDTINGDQAELIAVLDEDTIPSPLWLRELVPSILQDEKVALVSSPKQIYNLPDGDPLAQSMDTIYDSISLMQDALNIPFYTGSGWVARRSAIEGMGCIPTDAFQEDMWISVLLIAQGWKTVYLRRFVLYGLVGNTFGAHIEMSKRRFVGMLSLIRLLIHTQLSKMTVLQRFVSLCAALHVATGTMVTCLSMVAIPCMLLSGKPFIIYAGSEQLTALLRFSYVYFLATWIHGYVVAMAAQMHKPIWPLNTQTYSAPYELMTLVSRLNTTITPTSAISTGSAEKREKKAYELGTLITTLRMVLWDQGAAVLLVPLAACMIGAYRSANASFTTSEESAPHLTAYATQIAIRVAWPPALALWTSIVASCWAPLQHAFFSDTPPGRESYLLRDPTTGIACPNDAKDLRTGTDRVRVSQRFAMLAIIYFTVAFLASWM